MCWSNPILWYLPQEHMKVSGHLLIFYGLEIFLGFGVGTFRAGVELTRASVRMFWFADSSWTSAFRFSANSRFSSTNCRAAWLCGLRPCSTGGFLVGNPTIWPLADFLREQSQNKHGFPPSEKPRFRIRILAKSADFHHLLMNRVQTLTTWWQLPEFSSKTEIRLWKTLFHRRILIWRISTDVITCYIYTLALHSELLWYFRKICPWNKMKRNKIKVQMEHPTMSEIKVTEMYIYVI